VGRSCSTNGGDDEWVKDIGGKARGTETTGNSLSYGAAYKGRAGTLKLICHTSEKSEILIPVKWCSYLQSYKTSHHDFMIAVTVGNSEI
jgi:hypothetical protein